MKLSKMSDCRQSALTRYETGLAVPPLELLLWYADHFDVSMDYIFGRTDEPQGKLYDYKPKIIPDTEELRQFIEMCFDPNSPVSERLKNTMIDMFLKEGKSE
jgi:transcriptional regulator with XRE-family HTH domain